MIWDHREHSTNADDVADAIGATDCRFCSEPLVVLLDSGGENFLVEKTTRTSRRLRASVCPTCGWWWSSIEQVSIARGKRSRGPMAHRPHQRVLLGSTGILKNLDLDDVSTPLQEVRAFLTARNEASFAVHPQLFEETVASVFRSAGFRAEVTNYSGDDGIDVLLHGPGDKIIGVQVKRYRDAIDVGQIRELLGAMIINGITRGVFVTTSRFQSGVPRTVDLARKQGMLIDLVDGTRFMQMLRVGQRDCYQSLSDPNAPFTSSAGMIVRMSEHPLWNRRTY